MQARVKADCHLGVVRACAGMEFVKDEWRNVPAEQEHDPPNNPFLEWRDGPKVAPEPEPAPEPATPEEALAGTLADVKAFTAKMADPDDLLKMQEMELAGKARQGALDAIETRLAQLDAEFVGR